MTEESAAVKYNLEIWEVYILILPKLVSSCWDFLQLL